MSRIVTKNDITMSVETGPQRTREVVFTHTPSGAVIVKMPGEVPNKGLDDRNFFNNLQREFQDNPTVRQWIYPESTIDSQATARANYTGNDIPHTEIRVIRDNGDGTLRYRHIPTGVEVDVRSRQNNGQQDTAEVQRILKETLKQYIVENPQTPTEKKASDWLYTSPAGRAAMRLGDLGNHYWNKFRGLFQDEFERQETLNKEQELAENASVRATEAQMRAERATEGTPAYQHEQLSIAINNGRQNMTVQAANFRKLKADYEAQIRSTRGPQQEQLRAALAQKQEEWDKWLAEEEERIGALEEQLLKGNNFEETDQPYQGGDIAQAADEGAARAVALNPLPAAGSTPSIGNVLNGTAAHARGSGTANPDADTKEQGGGSNNGGNGGSDDGGGGNDTPTPPAPIPPAAPQQAGVNETERLSRLADRLNNRLYYQTSMGSSGFGGNSIQGAGQYQMNPVETEDMRQHGINRDLRKQTNLMERQGQAYERQRQRNRAQNIQDYYQLDRIREEYTSIGIPTTKSQIVIDMMNEKPPPSYEEITARAIALGIPVPGPVQTLIANYLNKKLDAYGDRS
jgi:hypothetical protein